jgi:putative membrane protein
MDISKTGFWAMILCWISAIGGIALAIRWAASKGRPRVDDEILRKSLERRLNSGEISHAEYEKRLGQLRQENTGRGNPLTAKKPPPKP